MIEKLKYDYKLSIPQVDEYLRQTAITTSPDLFAKSASGQAFTSDVDLQLCSTYSTNGWDTVSVCLVSDLNTAIEKQKRYPLSMDYQVIEGKNTYQVKADFGPWSIIAGGDGANINLKIPFKNLNCNFGGESYTSQQCEAIIQSHLAFFPAPKKIADPGTYQLEFEREQANGASISVIEFNSDLPSLSVAPLVQTVFSEWLNSNETLKNIQILFATAQLNMPDNKDFEWLIPTYSSYAYTDINGDLTKSKFGVLCMVKDRIAPDIHQMPAIDFSSESKNNFAFMINREVFVEYQLMPSLPQAFENASSENFKFDGTRITADNLQLPSVRYGLLDYYPELNQMTMTITETQIICELDFTTNISPGIDAKTFVKTTHTVTLGYNDNNEPIMVYEQDGDVITRNQTEVAAGVIVTEVIAEIIVAVVGIGVGNVVKKIIHRVLVALVVAVMCAIISSIIHLIIEKVVSEGVQKALPSIQPMATAAVKYVKWPFLASEDNQNFKPSDICLNGTLCFIGVIE